MGSSPGPFKLFEFDHGSHKMPRIRTGLPCAPVFGLHRLGRGCSRCSVRARQECRRPRSRDDKSHHPDVYPKISATAGLASRDTFDLASRNSAEKHAHAMLGKAMGSPWRRAYRDSECARGYNIPDRDGDMVQSPDHEDRSCFRSHLHDQDMNCWPLAPCPRCAPLSTAMETISASRRLGHGDESKV